MGTRRRGALAVLWLLAVPATGQSPSSGPHYRDFNAPVVDGAPGELGCLKFEAVRPSYNPVDLYKAARACLIAGRHGDAVPLFTLAEVYGRYDGLRVVDPTVRGAAAQARTATFAEVIESDYAAFGAAARQWLEPGAIPTRCAEIGRVGPPEYYPRYMLAKARPTDSGVSGDGLVPGFDRAAGWRKALDSYLHCPV